ncbi:MAG: hypothetical protein H7282_07455 [Cytophagaceae bacterium]|nr:hypothetical protein [Cytophagaceae bacterium]
MLVYLKNSSLMFRILFIFLLFNTSIASVKAQKTAVLDDSLQEFVFSEDYLEILEDKGGKLTIKDVSSSTYQNKFVLNKSSYPYNEHIESTYWIKFKLKNNSKSGKNFLLESYAPHTNDFKLYIQKGNDYDVKVSGLDLYFYNREYVNKNLILDLPLDTNSIHTFYVRVLSENHSSFDFRIKQQTYFFFYSVNEYYFLGMFYGIMVIMAIYNLLMFFALWEKVYIYYVLYVICGMLTTLADDGLGYQYVWIHFPHINSYMGSHIAPSLLLLTFVFYSREFLQLKYTLPFYDKLILSTTAVYFIYYALKLTVLPIYLHSYFVYILPFITIYIAAWKCFLNGQKPARFFIIGFTFVLISIVIIKLRSDGSINGNLFTVYSLNYGLVLEVLVLSFAMAERFRFAKKEKEKALTQRNHEQFRALSQFRINEELKDKVNQEIETKIAERTIELNDKNVELEQANSKLKEMTDIANQMSIKLDIDNWNLRKKVNESLQARMRGQEVSDEEFRKIFPDENACLKYLHELKWNDSFSCYKCKNKEGVDDLNVFGKKCVRCNYYESEMAHTLFHGIKFPLNKAFYIAYLSVHKKDKLTLDELSELVGLRRNTCWKFRQKIAFAIDNYKVKTKVNIISSWEDLIFIVEA